MIARWRNAHQWHNPRRGVAGSLASALAALTLLLAPISSLHAQERAAREVPAASKRLSIAFLGLENQTGNSELAHWCLGTMVLSGSLGEVKAVRVLPTGAIHYALREVGLRTGDPIDPNRARLMGELIEAQRVIWGRFSKRADRWQVTVRVMNVATGAVTPEFWAEAEDWFDIRDKLDRQILAALGVTPAPEESRRAQERWTQSAETIECCLRVYWSQDQKKPASASEWEKLCRQALAADPNCAPAYCDLAGALATQGKLEPAEEAARKALHLHPDAAGAYYVLGWVSLARGQLYPSEATSWFERAEAKFRQATQLDPDDAECQVYLANVCAQRGKVEEAAVLLEQTVLLDRTSAMAHATLAVSYAFGRQAEAALRELQEARRYILEGPRAVNVLSAIAAAYGYLGRPAEALDYYERMLLLNREIGTNPDGIRQVEEQIEFLKRRLPPTFIQASPPRRYTEAELDKILRDKLTEDERSIAANPFTCTEPMRDWAKELTRGAQTDLDKAKAIFEELSARLETRGQPRSRTARQVFEAWKNPGVYLVCMDRAVLFVALARAADVNAFFVHVTQLAEAKVINHACAAVFLEDRVLLVDPAQHWFGAPHQQYTILDDLRAAAFLCFNNRDGDPAQLAAYRVGVNLWPDSLPARVFLAGALYGAGQQTEARQVFAAIAVPQSQDWEAAIYWAVAAQSEVVEQHWEQAVEHLRKSLSLFPDQSMVHLNLGRIYLLRHRRADARAEFRACLRYEPSEQVASVARAAIARINEEIGVEAAPETTRPAPKPQ